jgi:hypothetical protein
MVGRHGRVLPDPDGADPEEDHDSRDRKSTHRTKSNARRLEFAGRSVGPASSKG